MTARKPVRYNPSRPSPDDALIGPPRTPNTVGPTITDVAREAGVSAATVSRILNGRHHGDPAIRDRVQATALALGYVPHGGARSLVTRRNGALGVLLPNLFGEFWVEFLRGIDDTSRERGIHLLATSSHADPVQLRNAAAAMRGRVDGYLIVAPGNRADDVITMLAQTAPVVVVGIDARASGAPSLMIDNAAGARAVAEHAMSRGFRHLAMITGPETNGDAIARRDAFRAAIACAGDDVTLTEFVGDFSQDSGWSAAHTMLAHPRRFEFCFACNDSMAIGAMSAFRDAGIRVPESLAIAGFDDVPMARYLTPALTTVHVPIEELGRRAMSMLISSVVKGAPAKPTVQLITTTLIVRGSTVMESKGPS
ncbi:MAG: LacI family DNA-binding transcriptional regulator [Gemmatimonadaceae bacterium]|nr:LacI family DNA-binding transcriptional regulator [Gemmatimonadaceae bacterium]